MMNIAAIISLIVNLSLVLAQNKECPKYLSLRNVKYRFVADGTGFSTCLGDIPHCVYTREMKFYCMSGENMKYEPVVVEASYENLKENVTKTSFGKAGGEEFDIDLTGTNSAIRMTLYEMDVEGRTQCTGIQVEKCGNKYFFGEREDRQINSNTYSLDLKPGYPITEVYGSRGLSNGVEVVDAIEVWIGARNKISCGGLMGSGFDATPKASVYGPCHLIGLEATGKSFIQSLTLKWNCLGVPDFFF